MEEFSQFNWIFSLVFLANSFIFLYSARTGKEFGRTRNSVVFYIDDAQLQDDVLILDKSVAEIRAEVSAPIKKNNTIGAILGFIISVAAFMQLIPFIVSFYAFGLLGVVIYSISWSHFSKYQAYAAEAKRIAWSPPQQRNKKGL